MAYEKLNFTAGQVLKAEHLNHMEEGIANPLDNIADGKVGKDVVAYILEPATLTFAETMGFYATVVELNYPIEDGKTYTVNYNGTNYECVANGEFIGNTLAGGGADNGIPFAVALMNDVWMFGNVVGDTTATVSISGVIKQPISFDYLPDYPEIDLTASEFPTIVAGSYTYFDTGASLAEKYVEAAKKGIVKMKFRLTATVKLSANGSRTFEDSEVTMICNAFTSYNEEGAFYGHQASGHLYNCVLTFTSGGNSINAYCLLVE